MRKLFKSKSSTSAPEQSTATTSVASVPANAKDSPAAAVTAKQATPSTTTSATSKDTTSASDDIDSDDEEALARQEEEESGGSAAKGKEPVLETYPISTVSGPSSKRSGMSPMAVFPEDKSHQLYYCDVTNSGEFDMVLRRGSPKASVAGSFAFRKNAKGQGYILISHTDGTKSAFSRTLKAGKGLKYMTELKASPPSPVTGSHKCLWKVTFGYGVNKLTGTSSYKIMDMDEKIVYAAFIKEMGWNKVGRLVVLNENVGERFLEQILLCALALNEAKRRQNKRARGPGTRMAARGVGGLIGTIIGNAI